jgi:glyoxylate/hydroxypyruvate reductase A
VVNHDDLIASLNQGHIAHAVLDVFEQEPLPSGHPLWLHPKITVLPHISAMTSVETASKVAAANIIEYQQEAKIPASIDLKRGY